MLHPHRCRNPLSSYVILGRTIVMSLLVGSLYYQLDLSECALKGYLTLLLS